MARHKLFATINILGLSVSIACSLLLFIYVSDQLDYDKHHNPGVYRLSTDIKMSTGEEAKIAANSFPIAPAIEEGVEGVKVAARVMSTVFFGGTNVIKYKDNSFSIEDGVLADSSLFDILTFDLVEGDKSKPFTSSKSVVLERELAQKIFGNDRALGKVFKINTSMGSDDYEVSAVYDGKTFKSHLAPSLIMPMHNESWKPIRDMSRAQWVGNNMFQTYLAIDETKNPSAINESITNLYESRAKDQIEATGIQKKMIMQPVSTIHTDSNREFGSGESVNPTFIYALFTIGLVILLLACVNYIYLSTSQSGNRALEVGIKKVMGITSKGLITQFLGESFFIVFVSIGLSILLAELSLPFFNSFVDHPVVISSANIGEIALFLFAFWLITSVVAGLYPAIYLASFKPTSVLKGKNKDKAGVVIMRKILVSFQFVISIVLISCILIISDQMNFLFNKDLGFNASSRLIVPLNSNEATEKYEVLKKQIAMMGDVSHVSGVFSIPGSNIANDILLYKDGQSMDDAMRIINNYVDHDYFKSLEINIIAGRDFTHLDHQDTLYERIIINELAAVKLDLTPEQAVGEILHFDWQNMSFNFQIVGVAENINQLSLHQELQPLMYWARNAQFKYLIVETNIASYDKVKAQIQTKWREVLPDEPYETYSLDSHLQTQYSSDVKTMNLIKFFAYVSVLISCMGLYALSLFIAEKKFKEIGVRKALGAKSSNILLLVSKELSGLVIISFMLAVPISYYCINFWLDSFAYRITPAVSTYLIAGVISIGIAWLTISYQSIKAAATNPVDTLRSE